MAVKEPTTEPERSRQPLRKPRRSRYLLAVPLLVGGLALALGIGLGGGETKSDQAKDFPRVAVPGAFTLHVEHPTTFYVYSEGTACLDYPNCHGQLYPVTVRVSGPAGNAVKVEPADGPTYMVGGMEGVAVAKFDATTTGNYRVAASTDPYSEGVIAVGEAFPVWTQDWVPVLAMALLWAAGIAFVIVPIVLSGRKRTSARSSQSSQRLGAQPRSADRHRGIR